MKRAKTMAPEGEPMLEKERWEWRTGQCLFLYREESPVRTHVLHAGGRDSPMQKFPLASAFT